MGEIGDDWREWREESRRHRTDKQEWSKELLAEWCKDNEVEYKEIQPWHVRLSKENNVIDIYPQRQRAFFHFRKRWTTYRDLISFITSAFKKQTNQ